MRSDCVNVMPQTGMLCQIHIRYALIFYSYRQVGEGQAVYVYQKAYLEFFFTKEKLDLFVEKCMALPSLTYITLNKDGQGADHSKIFCLIYCASHLIPCVFVLNPQFGICKIFVNCLICTY
jgi:hypothetical protein